MTRSIRRFLHNNMINLAIAIAGLMGLGVGVALVPQTLSSYVAASHAQHAHDVVGKLLRAAAFQAQERGLTSVALGARPASETLVGLQRVRAEGDASLNKALNLAGGTAFAGAELETHVARVRMAWEELREARSLIDLSPANGTSAITGSEWLAVITELIAATASLREEILMLVESPAGIARRNLSIIRSAWVLSENAGQIRGIVAYHVAAGEPITSGHLDQIRFNRTLVSSSLDELLALSGQPGLPAPLGNAIESVEDAIRGDFARELDAMLARAGSGDYPLDALAWYEVATAAIDSVLDLSASASLVTVAHLERIARNNAAALGAFLVFAAVAGGLALFSLARVRRNADALFLRQELVDITLRSIGDAVITTDREGVVQYLNPVAEELTGWPVSGARGRPVEEVFRIIHEETREPAVVPVAEVLRTGNVRGLANHTVLIARDGSERAVTDSAAPIRNPAGVVHGVVLVFRDAERERSEERKLAASEERYRRFIELAPYGVLVQSEGRLVFVNPRAVEMLGGRSDQDLIGREILDFLHPDDHAGARQRLRHLNEERAAVPALEERWLRLDGSTFDGEAIAVPYEHEGRAASLVLLQDISERKEAERHIQDLNRALEHGIRERDAALEALHHKEEETSAIVDNLFDCVISIDASGTVRSANPALTTVFGYQEQEVVGRNVSMLMAEPDAGQHDNYLARFAETGESSVIGAGRDVTGRHRDGRAIPLHLSVREYRVRGERLFVGILQDISERQKFITELTQARNDAEQANRAKSAFLAAMSHEIRTPMNGVIGLLDVLEHTRMTSNQADLVTTIRTSAHTLLRIIDDILDFSKIEAGRLEIERAPVSIPDLVEGLVASMVPVADRQDVDLALFVDPRIPERVLSDDVRLRQVLYNLLGNAVKFAGGRPAQHGLVAIRAEIERETPLTVCFRIVDNGIGMSPETVRSLFQAFAQAGFSTTRRFGGTGLGLPISRRLVDMMGGEIDVDSRLGEGSTFRVVLPFEPAPEQPRGRDPDLAGVHCAIVDAPGLETRDLRVYLEHAGASVEIVGDVSGLAPVAREHSGPVVGIRWVTDGLALSQKAGPENLRHLRIVPGRKRRMRVDNGDVVTLDCAVFVQRTLVRAVAVAAGLASPETFQEPARQRLPGEDHPPPSVAEARASNRLILVAEDDMLNQKVILRQLALLGHAAEVADDGKQALDLWRDGGYALVLTDLHMPEMDGYSLASSIRAEEQPGSRTPILALTANALKGEAGRAMEAGMDEYLTKPVPLEQLRTALERWLPEENAPDVQGHAGVGEEGSDRAQPPIFDVSVLVALVGDEAETLHGFVDDYLGSLKMLSEALETAGAADGFDTVRSNAHRLKSSSRSVGALQLADICEDLEHGAAAGEREQMHRALQALTLAREAVEQAIRQWKRGFDREQGRGPNENSGSR